MLAYLAVAMGTYGLDWSVTKVDRVDHMDNVDTGTTSGWGHGLGVSRGRRAPSLSWGSVGVNLLGFTSRKLFLLFSSHF